MKYVPKELRDTADASRGREGLWKRIGNVVFVVLFFGLIYLLLGFVAELFRLSDQTSRRLIARFLQQLGVSLQLTAPDVLQSGHEVGAC